jgi:hemin uptake protein HemP
MLHQPINPRPKPISLTYAPAQSRAMPSEALLRGKKAIGILHNGNLYKLQATKLGKLILTK